VNPGYGSAPHFGREGGFVSEVPGLLRARVAGLDVAGGVGVCLTVTLDVL
jgi:hypothetical protein